MSATKTQVVELFSATLESLPLGASFCQSTLLYPALADSLDQDDVGDNEPQPLCCALDEFGDDSVPPVTTVQPEQNEKKSIKKQKTI